MAASGRRRAQLRTRVLAGVLAVTIVAFAAFDTFSVTDLRGYLISRTDATLQTVLNLSAPRLDRLLQHHEQGNPVAALQAGLGTYDYLAFVPTHGPASVLDADPSVKPQLPADLTTVAADRRADTVVNVDGPGRLRLSARTVDGGTLVVTTSLDEVNKTVQQLRLVIIAGSLIAVALIALGVALVVRRGLRPLETMANQADRINAGELTDRVGPDDPRSEVGRLATALNGMLTRIDTSVQQRQVDQDLMRRFFADASHELRTPLASLRANAELYQQGALPDRPQVDEAMRRIRLEAQRMSRLVDDMLGLARLDQHPSPQRDTVDLTDVLHGCVERARVAEPQRTWHTDIAPDLVVTGDEELLQRAVDNLITNVRAHTPDDTTATISANRTSAAIVVEVSDNGPGVTADRLPRIFDRFYRADHQPSRPGAGLGLAIVTEIAATHHGQVTATLNDPHGLRVTLTLPTTIEPDDRFA